MPLSKTWAGVTQTNASTTAGAYSAADNWEPISLVNASYSWTVSGSGTNNYFLRTAANGNPGLAQPANVQQLVAGVRTNMTSGTAGALTASQWGWGDADTLGYNTIYVRLAGGGDPDAQDDKHVTLTAIPATGDDVRIPSASTQAITSGLDQSGVAIGDFIVESGYTKAIATADAPLQIDPDRFEFSGEGESHIDVGAANITLQVFATTNPNEGERGLYLVGSNIAALVVQGGAVGLAALNGQTSTVATARVMQSGASLWLGEGCTTTLVEVLGGECVQRCASTTTKLFAGQLTTEEEGTIGTLSVYAGTATLNSAGTITTLNAEGATLDFTKNGRARTVTTLNHNAGLLKYYSGVLTITTYNRNTTKPITISVAAA